MCVAMRSRKYRSWETTMAQPAKDRRASSKDRMVSTSRSLVGSSSMSTLAPERTSLASCTRLRSPPLSVLTSFCCWSPRKPNHDTYARDSTEEVPSMISWSLSVISVNTVLSSERPSRPWDTQAILAVSPIVTVPASGCSRPMMSRRSVVLPAPLGPMTPTIPARGRVKVRPSKRMRSPNTLRTPSMTTTFSPRRGPGGR
mmetsp:Transcript_561/g.1716  ORF Transcript_561/g.1716 Transcript_561/m.1716 type:complete len:200 (-) Transcript_561:159-758(-)